MRFTRFSRWLTICDTAMPSIRNLVMSIASSYSSPRSDHSGNRRRLDSTMASSKRAMESSRMSCNSGSVRPATQSSW